MTRLILIIIASVAIVLSFELSFAKGSAQSPLAKIHADIVKDYPQMTHIDRAAVQSRLTQEQSDVVILDTRPMKEYNVSHIKGALQVDPKIEPEEFLEQFGPQISGKTVILYCSVGRRSTRLGNRLAKIFERSGVKAIHNLEGGLFGWHNDNYELQNTSGMTTAIHPYNPFWGRLIENKKQISYSPKK